jgi:hypothetical protein
MKRKSSFIGFYVLSEILWEEPEVLEHVLMFLRCASTIQKRSAEVFNGKFQLPKRIKDRISKAKLITVLNFYITS